MYIIGIDPAINRSGIAIAKTGNKTIEFLEIATIKSKGQKPEEKLLDIGKTLRKNLGKYKDDEAMIIMEEPQAYSTGYNPTIVRLSMAAGVMLVVAFTSLKKYPMCSLKKPFGWKRNWTKKVVINRWLKYNPPQHLVNIPHDAIEAAMIIIESFSKSVPIFSGGYTEWTQ